MKQKTLMKDLVEEYIQYKIDLGYKLKIEGRLLRNFARFADEIGHHGSLTTDLMLKWATLPSKSARLYQARRLEIVRCFAKYRSIFDPRTEIPGRQLLGRAHRRRQPNVYTVEDIEALISAAHKIFPSSRLRRETIASIICLLACTGLRISEALNLDKTDFDRQDGVLIVRETKFRKSRLVPLHPSAKRALIRYEVLRDRAFPSSLSKALFLSGGGRRLTHAMALYGFQCAKRIIKRQIQHGSYRPRLHDLRHTFACRRIQQWYKEKADIDSVIPALSTYLGHAKVSDTYWYLTGTSDLLYYAARRFKSPTLRKGDH
jgi:integrase